MYTIKLNKLSRLAFCSNKDTVLIDHLDALSPEERLTLFTNLSTLLLLGEIMICWLFGQMDPLGEQSRHAGAWGAVAHMHGWGGSACAV